MLEFSELNFNSVENVPGIEARAAFTINSATVFTPVGRGYFVVKEDVDSYRPLLMKRCRTSYGEATTNFLKI